MMNDCSKTEIYLSEKARMTKACESGFCRIRCENCPLDRRNSGADSSCMELELKHREIAVKIVQGWSNTHPKKTYLSEFLMRYPHAPLDEKGLPKGVCPYYLGLKDIEECKKGCMRRECWNHIID